MYNSLFEIIVGTMNSFIAAALASSGVFCFAAVASASVVLILPGYIVLCGALELANRSIISGSVRLVYSVLYSLFLGFGLASGSEVYRRITNLSIVGSTDYTCSALRGPDAPWWRATISPWFFFLTAPAFLAFIGARNGQKLWRHETVTQVLIGAAGWVCNYFCSKVFINRSDLTSAIGSFVVGILGNIYGKATRTSPFIQVRCFVVTPQLALTVFSSLRWYLASSSSCRQVCPTAACSPLPVLRARAMSTATPRASRSPSSSCRSLSASQSGSLSPPAL